MGLYQKLLNFVKDYLRKQRMAITGRLPVTLPNLRSVHLFPKLQIPKIHKNIQKIKCYLYRTPGV